jgi:NAD/NADP transhydrogenase beta subunit
MDHKQQGQFVAYAVGGVLFLLIFAFRMRRMMQSRPFNVKNVWILPAFFITMTVLTLSRQLPQGREWLWLGASFVIGAALGWFRAKTIRLTLHPETHTVMAQGSPIAMVFILAIFAVRFGLRGVLAAESGALGISIALIDSAFLAMACGLFVARAVEMGIRATKLLSQAPASGATVQP